MTLSIEKISHSFQKRKTVLNDISLTVENGILGILGPNGAGKSTLLRIMATLLRPTSGRICLNNFDGVESANEVRKSLGYLPQDFGFHPKATCLEMMDYLAILKNVSDRFTRISVIEQLLSQVNLWSDKDKPLGHFSRGMLQRFGIAQACLGRPSLLVLDEPTAGLDLKERESVLALITELSRDSVVVLSTHIVDDVAELADTIAILTEGDLIKHDTPDGLVKHLENRLWNAKVSNDQAAHFAKYAGVISVKKRSEATDILVVSENTPGTEFTACQPNIEAAYLAALAGHFGYQTNAA